MFYARNHCAFKHTLTLFYARALQNTSSSVGNSELPLLLVTCRNVVGDGMRFSQRRMLATTMTNDCTAHVPQNTLREFYSRFFLTVWYTIVYVLMLHTVLLHCAECWTCMSIVHVQCALRKCFLFFLCVCLCLWKCVRLCMCPMALQFAPVSAYYSSIFSTTAYPSVIRVCVLRVWMCMYSCSCTRPSIHTATHSYIFVQQRCGMFHVYVTSLGLVWPRLSPQSADVPSERERMRAVRKCSTAGMKQIEGWLIFFEPVDGIAYVEIFEFYLVYSSIMFSIIFIINITYRKHNIKIRE